MAADILVYKATHVPVGEDQKQHLELARDIAQKFNNDFGVPDFFPAARAGDRGRRHPGDVLRDGTKKDVQVGRQRHEPHQPDRRCRPIANKIKRAKTDPHPLPAEAKELEGRPEAENLLNIYAALADQDRDAVIAQFAGQQFSGFKTALADLTVAKAVPHRVGMRRLLADPAKIDRVLKDGAAESPGHRHPHHG
jgi:tryptophanyl-tRNA synthetase